MKMSVGILIKYLSAEAFGTSDKLTKRNKKK
jgi:hypothetical protein